MKIKVPEELLHNPELVKELARKLLTPEQYNKMFPAIVENVDFRNLSNGQALSKWLEDDFPKIKKYQIIGFVGKIFNDLRERGLLDNENFYISEEYGCFKNNTVIISPKGYSIIRKYYIKDDSVFDTIDNSPIKGYKSLSNLIEDFEICPRNYVYACSKTLHQILSNKKYIINDEHGKRPTKKGRKYIKALPKVKDSEQLYCVFKISTFKKLIDEIQFKFTEPKASKKSLNINKGNKVDIYPHDRPKNVGKPQDDIKGYSISQIAKLCGYEMKTKPQFDPIIKQLNQCLKNEIIYKPEGQNYWVFLDWILEEQPWWGYNEVMGKRIQAKFYDNENVRNRITKLINELREESNEEE